uniref:AlNc14C13G1531 protein n=1 Tax=Albugo laibachii Nc14 TaxID=890382 RepID=F0W3G3_9STRA|nr:AlNc14C13G1531 [Albugo laibachii Nc14]CCA16333.1 AlNc14C20G2108 [Albugo laibachii Nc14]|eukprot:CCA16333.1 AlNc14C20G2108 [Albugo laibachii Nc14]
MLQMERVTRDHKAEMKRATREHKAEMKRATREHKAEMKRKDREQKIAMERMTQEHKADMERKHQRHDTTIRSFLGTLNSSLDQLSNNVIDSNREMASKITDHFNEKFTIAYQNIGSLLLR